MQLSFLVVLLRFSKMRAASAFYGIEIAYDIFSCAKLMKRKFRAAYRLFFQREELFLKSLSLKCLSKFSFFLP